MRSNVHTPEFFQQIDATLSQGRVWRGILVSRAKDGRHVHFDATVSPIVDSDGECTHHVAVKRDITERLAAEARLRATNEELEQARDAALEASRVKTQFLANMSHELRTPLNAIIGYSELLTEEAEDLDQDGLAQDAEKIRNAGRHLLGLINDILDLSKIEAGRFDLYTEPVDVQQLLDEVVATITPLARERGNRVILTNDLAHDAIETDPTRLKQILLNLLSNANKFTEEGTIELSTGIHPEDEGAFFLAVRDTGIGLEEEQLDGLFQPFVQADSSTTRKYGGTGLGLAISQRFAELLGGHIQVESRPNEGSTFTVRLPLVAGATLEAPATRAAQAGRRVLVIDDDPNVHDLLVRTLEPAGFEVLSARAGKEGLERARTEKPDLIILDVVMPSLDGWSVLAELKKEGEATQSIPVLMLTFLQNRSAGLALGAADYLIKPVETSRLVQVVRHHAGHVPAHVLVVEDDGPTRELMRRVLSGAGYRVTEAENGRVALDTLPDTRPDVILLDLMMPEVDGFTFLEELRRRESHADTPVVVVTAKILSPEERERLVVATQEIVQKGDVSGRELMTKVLRHVSTVLHPSGS
jgi:signal transduction histidine kinase/CheY-like chemotaxis protein